MIYQRRVSARAALQHFANAREYPQGESHHFTFLRNYFIAFFAGLFNSTFEVLYDNDVLSVEAFEMWKNSKDLSEGIGKNQSLLIAIATTLDAFLFPLLGVAICSTRQFFTKLAEDKDGVNENKYSSSGLRFYNNSDSVDEKYIRKINATVIEMLLPNASEQKTNMPSATTTSKSVVDLKTSSV